jgi:hypothetical protein
MLLFGFSNLELFKYYKKLSESCKSNRIEKIKLFKTHARESRVKRQGGDSRESNPGYHFDVASSDLSTHPPTPPLLLSDNLV